MKIIETVTAEQSLDIITGWLEADAGVGQVCAFFQPSNGFPRIGAHVDQIQIDDAHLQIAAGPQDTFAFRDDIVLDML